MRKEKNSAGALRATCIWGNRRMSVETVKGRYDIIILTFLFGSAALVLKPGSVSHVEPAEMQCLMCMFGVTKGN